MGSQVDMQQQIFNMGEVNEQKIVVSSDPSLPDLDLYGLNDRSSGREYRKQLVLGTCRFVHALGLATASFRTKSNLHRLGRDTAISIDVW
jgi:hypothetical protein